MATAGEINERRRELFRRMTKEGNLRKVAEQLSQKFNVSFERVRNDWYNRDEWLKEAFHFENKDALFDELISEKNEIKKELKEVIDEIREKGIEGNENKLVRLYREYNKTNDSLLEALQNHGDIAKEPEKQEIDIQGEVSVLERARELIEDEGEGD